MNRKSFIKKTLIGLSGFSLLGGFYSWQIEPFRLEFTKVKMPIKNLPDFLIGKKLMQISDIHVGNRFDYNFIIESFIKAQKLNPDFVVYTGDYISLHNKKVQFDKLTEVFKNTVKGKLGTVGILGNHDYGVNWAEMDIANKIERMLIDSEVNVLRNAKIELNGLNFIGFDDYWGLNFNPKPVMDSYDASKPSVLLCHNPDVCDLDVWNGYKGWILAGHTHGGQVKPPFLDAPMLPVKNKRYQSGLIDLQDGRKLYINRALGCLWQVRFNVRPEITVFELQEA
jgi:predicted MPP superfamily phosphohydrolase